MKLRELMKKFGKTQSKYLKIVKLLQRKFKTGAY